MENHYETVAHMSEPLPTSADVFGQWLTVQEAVAHCLSKGLHRTPKTVRKWAMRSSNLELGSAEIVAKAQDTENGFRWLIERASLDVKIAQEIEFEVRKITGDSVLNMSEPVPTSTDMFGEVRALETSVEPVGTGEHISTQVPTSAHSNPDYLDLLKTQLDRAQQQLDVKDRQIDALLECDRETNILIQGLQTSLTKVVEVLPDGRRDAV